MRQDIKDEIVEDFLDNINLTGNEIRIIAKILLYSFIIEVTLLISEYFYSK